VKLSALRVLDAPRSRSSVGGAPLTHLRERSELRMLSKKRHRNRLSAGIAGVVAADQRILESNLAGECSRLCVRGGGATYARLIPITSHASLDPSKNRAHRATSSGRRAKRAEPYELRELPADTGFPAVSRRLSDTLT
jgi:hypothetical protein